VEAAIGGLQFTYQAKWAQTLSWVFVGDVEAVLPGYNGSAYPSRKIPRASRSFTTP